jgi:hypothetical protein
VYNFGRRNFNFCARYFVVDSEDSEEEKGEKEKRADR